PQGSRAGLMDAQAQNHRQGEGAALAFCVAGALAAVVLLPATLLLDLKATAGAWAAALACLGVVALLWQGQALRLPPPRALLVLLLGLGLGGLSAAASPYRGLGLEDPGLASALILGAGLWLAPPAWTRRSLEAWRWATLAVAGYALAQRLGVEPLQAYAQAGSRDRAMGSFGNAGYLAAFLCLSWPLFLSWRGGRRGFGLALALAALFATQSRAGLLALAAQLLLWGAQAWRGGWRPQPRLFVMLAVLLGAELLLFPASAWLRPTLRLPLWRASWDLWMQRPWLGWGPGSFALAFQDHGSQGLVGILSSGGQYAGDPHQLVLAVGCAVGLAGLAAFAGAMALLLGGLSRAEDPDFRPLWLGLAGLLAQSQCDRFFFQPGVLIPLGVVVAALPREGAALPPALRRPFAVALAPLVAALLWTGLHPLLAYHDAVGGDAGAAAPAAAPQSLEDLQQAAQAGTDPAALDRLGSALAAAQRYREAAAAFDSAQRLAPSSGRAQNLGNCLMMLGDPSGAEAAFRKAVALDPHSADAHFSLGYALFDEKKLTQAVAELDTALTLDPGNPNALTLKRQITQ
ncbi:MAG TPA: tetratricopeptide repeat protein, partial [bacterium]|nr:tetratricopeptide repeat protein [bacterium]